MFSLTHMRLEGIRKWSLRLYRKEQLSGNDSLQGLSAVQKKKIIMKMFKSLSKGDMDNLKARAATYQRMVMAGESDPLAAMKAAGPLAAAGSHHRSSPASRAEVTPYEFFVKEQSSNPAVCGFANPRDKEKKLLEIYNSLPDKAREALEQRAAEYSTSRLHSGGVVPRAAPPPRPSPAVSKRQKAAARKAAAAAKKRAAEAEAKTQKKKKRAASPYAQFVKEQMPSFPDMPFTERMREIAKRWKALSEEERAARLATGLGAQKKQASERQQEEKKKEECVAQAVNANAGADAEAVAASTPAAEAPKSERTTDNSASAAAAAETKVEVEVEAPTQPTAVAPPPPAAAPEPVPPIIETPVAASESAASEAVADSSPAPSASAPTPTPAPSPAPSAAIETEDPVAAPTPLVQPAKPSEPIVEKKRVVRKKVIRKKKAAAAPVANTATTTTAQQ